MIEKERLEVIKRKLRFGVPPLTLDEARDLYQMATGELIPVLRRCWHCNAEGWVYLVEVETPRVPCPICNGSGYLKLAEWTTGQPTG